MAVYVPLHNVPLQFMDGSGDPLASGTLEFYLSGTSTPTNLFSDSSGTSVGTSITLNSSGYPESGGNVITLFRDTSIDYKIIGKNSGGATLWTADTLVSLLDVLSSTANGEGASLVSLEDSGGNYAATDVEAAFAELASTSSGEGASIIGIEDSAGQYTATDVEAALAEIKASGSFTATLTGMAASTTGTINWERSGHLVSMWAESTIVGTSDQTFMIMQGIPAAIVPTTAMMIPCGQLEDNNTQRMAGAVIFDTANDELDFCLLASGVYNSSGFTSSSDKGIVAGWCISYPLN